MMFTKMSYFVKVDIIHCINEFFLKIFRGKNDENTLREQKRVQSKLAMSTLCPNELIKNHLVGSNLKVTDDITDYFCT